MTGWTLFAALAAASGVLVWQLRFPTKLATFLAAALCLAAAGYAWQGRPGLVGQPAQPAVRAERDPDFLALRTAMFGRYGAAGSYLTPSDALVRYGAAGAAAQLLQGGINRDLNSTMLWTELGNVIAEHDDAVSPAARLAFSRAIASNRADPAPWFFLGEAYVRAGEFAAAQIAWRKALALIPPTVGYRRDIALRLALLDRLLATEQPPQ